MLDLRLRYHRIVGARERVVGPVFEDRKVRGVTYAVEAGGQQPCHQSVERPPRDDILLRGAVENALVLHIGHYRMIDRVCVHIPCEIHAHWVTAVVVRRVHHRRQRDLLVVAQAGSLARLLSRLREDWEKDRRQDGDDGDHDEEFDESEPSSTCGCGCGQFDHSSSSGWPSMGA